MREAVFVRRHADAWADFERRLDDDADAHDADALADGYVRLGDDLAYAQTFYPGSATAAYLNDLSTEVHRRIYRNRREERGRVGRFFRRELPLALYGARWSLLASLALFLGSIGLGLASSAADPAFVRAILGDGYVNMTLANIERGDPLAVYKDAHQIDMTTYIALNNVVVSFRAFAGILVLEGAVLPAFSLGTAQTLFANGVMVGAFAHLFAAEGLAAEWFRVVFIHGAPELSAIVIAGGAGFALGAGVLFPGTYPRLVAFRRSAVRGLKIIVGAVPLWIFAALLEGFVTRYTEMPAWASACIIGASFAFLAFYAVWLPWRVGRELSAGDAALAPARLGSRP